MSPSWRALGGLFLGVTVGIGAGTPVDSPRSPAPSVPAPPQLVVLRGNRPAFAVPERRIADLPPQFRMDRMVLLLRPGHGQALDSLAAAQQDPNSPLYHHWLTPAQYAAQFGSSPLELATIASWLAAQGFHVDEVAPNGRMIFFSGAAAQVNAAFHAQMARFLARGEIHIANAADPSIPAEFAGVIAGIAGLDDARSAPAHTPIADFAAGSFNDLAPADVATIYDIAPLYRQGTDGAGATIAVLARSNLLPADIADFRNSFALPAQAPRVIVNATDPGTANETDLAEAELDAEWSGAIAPAASIDVVASASTHTTDGILLSAEYAVDRNLAPVIAVSYSECEADLGSAGSSIYNALWQQAAVQGISVVVAAGDSGAAACDDPTQPVATHGRAVNGLCSSPWSLCVGGTEFTSQSSAYWASDNGASGGSALSYVPEAAWNESGANSGLWAGGGGVSALYPRPSWQTGSGAWRQVPDVSLSSAARNSYLIWLHGAQVATSGTSASAQVMGAVAALLVGGRGERQGNLAPSLYAAAAVHPAAIHDILSGNNSVPGVAGFAAAPGYDPATGLGSIDAAQLFAAWGKAWLALRPCALTRQGVAPNCAPIRTAPTPQRLP